MPVRQQILYLWLAEGALDNAVIGWAFHDGSKGIGPGLPEAPEGGSPYATGVSALEDGWLLLQSPVLHPLASGAEHDVGYLPNEFVFERRIDVPA
jgi:hypothetical protein